MSASLLVILMGSRADEDHCHRIVDAARSFGLDTCLGLGRRIKPLSTYKYPGRIRSRPASQGLHHGCGAQ